MSRQILNLTLPYPPQQNHYYAVYRGRKVLSAKGRQYKSDVLTICRVERVTPIAGNLQVTFRAFRPRKVGDLDNLIKGILDSLQGSAFENDKQIIEIHAYRYDDKVDPRVEVEIQKI